MTKIIMIRHGQTDFNKNGIIQGIKDIPLNDTGLKQANEVSQELKNYKFDVFISSPLKRAYKTLDIIKNNLGYSNDNILIMNDFIERNFGKLDGTFIDKAHDLLQENNYKLFNGESNEEIKDRVINGLNKVIDSYKDKTILIASHSHVIKTILIYYNVYKNYNFSWSNASFLELNYNDTKFENILIYKN